MPGRRLGQKRLAKLWDRRAWNRGVLDWTRAFSIPRPYFSVLAAGHVPELCKATTQDDMTAAVHASVSVVLHVGDGVVFEKMSTVTLACFGATESAPALLSGLKSQGMPVIGARYYMDEMTPFKRIPNKDLSTKQSHMLKKCSHSPQKAALQQKTGYKVVAGDNATESWISATQLQLRRQNRLGRPAPKDAHLDQLAAQRMHQL